MGFWGGTVASAGPYANNLHLTPDNHTNTSALNLAQILTKNQYKIHFSQTRCLKYEDNGL